MRVALNAPIWLRVPPVRYGGTELIVYLLAEELVKQGHDVTVFASGDSLTSADLFSVFDEPQNEYLGTIPPDLVHSIQAYRRAGEFDLIHDHTGYAGVAFGSLIQETPVLSTLHGDFPPAVRAFYAHFASDVYYNAISEAQRASFPDLNYKRTVYNAIALDRYRFEADKEDFLLWVSRVNAQKAPHLAIEVARRVGKRLIMAGKIDPGVDQAYFDSRIAPELDGDRVRFLGEINEDEKIDLMARASCMLFPIQWAEPFGLVMAESLASGTPVVAWRNGSVPEVVRDGVGGFVVESLDGMVEATRSIGEIDPAVCRAEAESRFSPQRMALDYLSIYEEIIQERGAQSAHTGEGKDSGVEAPAAPPRLLFQSQGRESAQTESVTGLGSSVAGE